MLCACRNGSLWLRLIVLALAGLLALASWAPGDEKNPLPDSSLTKSNRQEWTAIESNRALVRRDLARGAVLVAFGTEMALAEYRTFADSITVHDCMGIEECVREELVTLRGSVKVELARHLNTEVHRLLAGLGEKTLLDALTKAIKADRPTTFALDEFTVEVGVATYRYWAVRLADPTAKDRQTALPVTRQIYVRLLLRTPPRMGP